MSSLQVSEIRVGESAASDLDDSEGEEEERGEEEDDDEDGEDGDEEEDGSEEPRKMQREPLDWVLRGTDTTQIGQEIEDDDDDEVHWARVPPRNPVQ